MAKNNDMTIILGPEYDLGLQEILRGVLEELRGVELSHGWGVGGSQELETAEVRIGAQRVTVEAETYIGLSVRGPEELVERIRTLVRRAARWGPSPTGLTSTPPP